MPLLFIIFVSARIEINGSLRRSVEIGFRAARILDKGVLKGFHRSEKEEVQRHGDRPDAGRRRNVPRC